MAFKSSEKTKTKQNFEKGSGGGHLTKEKETGKYRGDCRVGELHELLRAFGKANKLVESKASARGQESQSKPILVEKVAIGVDAPGMLQNVR